MPCEMIKMHYIEENLNIESILPEQDWKGAGLCILVSTAIFDRLNR